MQTALGHIRRADQDFHLIQPGDRVAVGVSGGKDSMLLLLSLAQYRHVRGGDFTLQGIMLTMGQAKPDTAAIQALAAQADVPLTVRHTDLYAILFERGDPRSPCPLCAKMRRAMLCEACQSLNANKLALGHHREDVLETLLMSLVFESRLHTFHPKTFMSRTGITVIRPLSYMPEREIIHLQRKLSLPVLHNPCPANGHTKRQEMKALLSELGRRYPRLQASMLTALRNDAQYGLWAKEPTDGADAEDAPPETPNPMHSLT